jgi:hypothetical protein
MTENFWGYLVNGIMDIFTWAVSAFPPAQQNSVIQSAPTIIFYAFAPVLVFVGSFLHLTAFATGVVLILGAEILRIVAAIWRFILKMIPAAS